MTHLAILQTLILPSFEPTKPRKQSFSEKASFVFENVAKMPPSSRIRSEIHRQPGRRSGEERDAKNIRRDGVPKVKFLLQKAFLFFPVVVKRVSGQNNVRAHYDSSSFFSLSVFRPFSPCFCSSGPGAGTGKDDPACFGQRIRPGCRLSGTDLAKDKYVGPGKKRHSRRHAGRADEVCGQGGGQSVENRKKSRD